jgi:hypothetical protein
MYYYTTEKESTEALDKEVDNSVLIVAVSSSSFD